jgi:hypothetical protein
MVNRGVVDTVDVNPVRRVILDVEVAERGVAG